MEGDILEKEHDGWMNGENLESVPVATPTAFNITFLNCTHPPTWNAPFTPAAAEVSVDAVHSVTASILAHIPADPPREDGEKESFSLLEHLLFVFEV